MSYIWHRSIAVLRPRFASGASAPLRVPHCIHAPSKRTAVHVRTFSAPRGAEAVRFSYFPDDARRKFEQWVQTNVPVLTVPRISSVKAMYLPFWSFKATARIKPVIGASITEEVSGPELQIYAGHVYPRAMVEVCKTHPTWARPFEPSMLDIGKGWSVEHVQPYETYESTAWAIVKETALAQLKRQHTLAASITFSAVESRRILMPVYEVTYKWWGEELRCFVNGSTGASYGVQQDIGGPMLAKAMGMLRNLAGPSGGQSLNPQKVGAVIDFLRHLSIDPRAVGPLVTLLGGALRPFLKLLFWPPFLVGSLLAFGGFTLSQAMLPIAKQRKSFAEWEEQRTAEKRMQAGMSDEWKYKATGGSYYEASSSSSSGSSSSSSGGSFYRSSRSTAGSASSAGQGSSSQSQRQQQQQEKAKPKGKKPPYVDENDYYAILGLPRSASVKEIQESFRMELLKYHPDHAEAAGWDMAAASERTRMIIKAYGTLRDPGKRAMYDSTYRFRCTLDSENDTMEVAVDKKHIKVLAKAGDFDEILRLYGPKWVKKASEYLAKKSSGEDGANNDEGEDVPVTTGVAYGATSAKDSSAADGANDNGDEADAVEGGACDEEASARVGELFAAASAAETAPVTAVKGKKKAGLTPLGLGLGLGLGKKTKATTIGLMPTEEEGDEAVPSDLITPSIPKKSKKKVGLALQPMEDGAGEGEEPAKGVPSGKKTTSKGKGKKDEHAEPAAKKRGPVAPSAYMLWSKESRPEVVASNPGLSFGDLGRKMGEVWKAMLAEEKAVWEEKAAEAKAALLQAAAAAAPELDETLTGGAVVDDGDAALPASMGMGEDAAGGVVGLVPSSLTMPMKAKKAPKEKKEKAVKKRDRYILPATGAGAGAGDSDSDSEDREQEDDDGFVRRKGKGAGKAKAKAGKKRTKREDEDEGEDDVEGEPDSALYLPVRKDARQLALEAAAARGRAPVIKDGVIDESEGVEQVMPRMTGKFDYKPYLPKVGATAALILPAYLQWREAVSAAAREGGPGSGGHRVQQLLTLLESTGRVTANVDQVMDVAGGTCTSGVLLGQVLSLEKLEDAHQLMGLGHGSGTGAGAGAGGYSSDTGSVYSQAAPDRDAFDDAVSVTGSQYGASSVTGPTAASSGHVQHEQPTLSRRHRARQWHILTLNLSLGATEHGKFPIGYEDADEEGVKKLFNGPTVCIPWLPPQDPCINSFFVLTGEGYAKALKQVLKPGTQVRGLIVCTEDASRVEYQEGRVYDVSVAKEYRAKGWTDCPYQRISVMWYDQLAADPSKWITRQWQTDNSMSPWEVTIDKHAFVLDAHVQHFAMDTPVFDCPRDVIEYMATTEASLEFRQPVDKKAPHGPKYYARIKSPMDLATMAKKCKDGEYAEAVEGNMGGAALHRKATGGGQAAMWEDFKLIIKNAKVFNEPDHLVYRQADEFQAELRRVKKAYRGPGTYTSKKQKVEGIAAAAAVSSASAVYPPASDDDAYSVGVYSQMSYDESMDVEMSQSQSQAQAQPQAKYLPTALRGTAAVDMDELELEGLETAGKQAASMTRGGAGSGAGGAGAGSGGVGARERGMSQDSLF